MHYYQNSYLYLGLSDYKNKYISTPQIIANKNKLTPSSIYPLDEGLSYS